MRDTAEEAIKNVLLQLQTVVIRLPDFQVGLRSPVWQSFANVAVILDPEGRKCTNVMQGGLGG